MKKCWILGLLAFLLAGCGAEPTFETLGDVPMEAAAAEAGQLVLTMPASAKASEKTEAGGQIYLCDGYTLSVETVPAGDLGKTLREVTGYSREQLDVIETMEGDIRKYHCVWASAGEKEMQVGRACVLDDGSYHYVVSVMAGESMTGKLQPAWQEIFGSIRLFDSDVDLNTGS